MPTFNSYLKICFPTILLYWSSFSFYSVETILPQNLIFNAKFTSYISSLPHIPQPFSSPSTSSPPELAILCLRHNGFSFTKLILCLLEDDLTGKCITVDTAPLLTSVPPYTSSSRGIPSSGLEISHDGKVSLGALLHSPTPQGFRRLPCPFPYKCISI